MYCLTTFRDPLLVVASLSGRFGEEEVNSVCRDLDLRLLRAEAACFLLDLSSFDPQAEAVLALLDRYVERSVESGIRVGRVVESRLVAHQLDRVAEEAGILDRVRNFGERELALAWLRALVD